MRHQVKGGKLGRTSSHRKATLRSMSIALITHHRVVTTLAKAKALSRVVEPLITRAKEDTMHNRRQVFSFLQDNDSTSKLFSEIGPKVGDRPGGYTRIIKIGYRVGDSATSAVIELVDYNDVKPQAEGAKKKRTRRSAPKSKPAKAAAETKEAGEATAEA